MANEEVIKVELDTDPKSLGYSGMDDATAAVTMNDTTLDTGTTTTQVPRDELVKAMVHAEWDLLSDKNRDLWHVLMLGASLDMSDTQTRDTLGEIWPASSATRANLVALQSFPTSRAHTIGISKVREGDVNRARGL